MWQCTMGALPCCPCTTNVYQPQHSARLVLLEVVTSNHDVWRMRLDARVLAQRSTTQDSSAPHHKPQSWQALQSLVASYGDAPRWSSAVQPRMLVDTSTGDVHAWARPVLQMLQRDAADDTQCT